MNNDAYKLKYLKYKARYNNLKKISGGMMALQSSEIREQRLSRENASKNRERRAILEAQEIYQLQERERKKEINLRKEIENRMNEMLDFIDKELERLENILKQIENIIKKCLKLKNYDIKIHKLLLKNKFDMEKINDKAEEELSC